MRRRALPETLEDGVITSVSIGYKNKDYVEIEGGARITQWTPFEVSLVSVPADPHATIGIRSMSVTNSHAAKQAKS